MPELRASRRRRDPLQALCQALGRILLALPRAQVVTARFNDAVDADGYNLQAWVSGVLCDYERPQVGTCQPSAMAFQERFGGQQNVVGFSLPGSDTCCDGDWYLVGKGSFALNYVSDTPA